MKYRAEWKRYALLVATALILPGGLFLVPAYQYFWKKKLMPDSEKSAPSSES